MNRWLVRMGLNGVLWTALAISTFAKSAKPLEIYFIDVEGGQATLVVSPAKRSLLIDTGFPGGRDSERILAAMQSAGIKKLDYLVITHFHRDHVGGVPELVQRIKVETFVDHGPDTETSDAAKETYAAYTKAIGRSPHVSLRPGDGLPFKDIRVQFVAAAGEGITSPLPGAGEANSYCDGASQPQPDTTENSQSLGLLISYRKFRFLDLGDLTEDKQWTLVCPNNLLGSVDLYLTTHHGGSPDNPKALVWAIHPRVAIMNNGEHKGGSPAAWQIVHDSPGIEDLWQLHYAADGGTEHNSAEPLIANVDQKSDGHFLKVTVQPDGGWKVKNDRNGYEKAYGK